MKFILDDNYLSPFEVGEVRLKNNSNNLVACAQTTTENGIIANCHNIQFDFEDSEELVNFAEMVLGMLKEMSK